MDAELYNRYIICAYECGGLTKAAEKLGITQPALSAGLGSMEKRLGFKIFNRRSIPMQLTAEGEIYMDYLYRNEKLREDYKKKIADLNGKVNEKLIIGGPVAYVESLLADAVVKFHAENPECKICIKNAPMPELVHMVKKGQVDCFISTSDKVDEGIKQVPIRKEKIYLCVPKAWEINEALKKAISSDKKAEWTLDYNLLDGQEYIFLEENQPLQRETMRFFKKYNIRPKNSICVNQVSAGLRLASRGIGIVFASDDALAGNGENEDLCIYPLEQSIFGRKIYFAYDGERYMSYRCHKLMKLLQEGNK